MADPFVLRPLTKVALPSSDTSAFRPPSSKQLLGQWFIVQTSLPFWRDKRNIKIAYSASPSSSHIIDQIDDTTIYQTLGSEKLKTVQGVSAQGDSEKAGAWDWRGSGWVKVVRNHWEILGHASYEGGDEASWIVVHTQKSFFTPAAIHVYSRKKEALTEATWQTLKATLEERQELKDLVVNVFQVQQE